MSTQSPQAECYIYSEVVNEQGSGGLINVSPAGTVNLGKGNLSSLRKPSSNLTQSVSNASSSSSSSGTLKKDSVANLNLLSTTNEAKVGEKPEIRQQIPVKLREQSSKLSVSGGSGGKDKSSKKMSAIGLKQSAMTASASNLSGSMGNIAKPLVEGGMQQILPFKLSEADAAGASGSGLIGVRKSSSKPGYQV